MPVFDRNQLSELFAAPFPDVGIGVESLFRDVQEKVPAQLHHGCAPALPGLCLGTAERHRAYAEAVAAALNQNCNFWQLSPVASVIERKVISWLGSLFGYPETAGGILTSGGSMANLMDLSVAMHDKAPIDLHKVGLSSPAALNQNCNFCQLSPVASVIERKVISWLGSLFGYPETAGGILTSGGSMVNLMALSVAMHDKAPIDLHKVGLSSLASPLVVYTSAEAHRSVDKGAAILGLGSDHVRRIPVDSDFRLRVDLLERAIAEDRRAGATPFCVVAAAGTVNSGAIDSIDDIADVCARESLWLHVDGAYGALFILSNRMKDRLSSCGRADSIALDPHKLLFAPLEAGCLIVRNREKLRDTFHFTSS